VYEQVLEPLSAAFAIRAFECPDLRPGERLIDVRAGADTAALVGAARGAEVLQSTLPPPWRRASPSAQTMPRRQIAFAPA
jgi:hypothetical protein